MTDSRGFNNALMNVRTSVLWTRLGTLISTGIIGYLFVFYYIEPETFTNSQSVVLFILLWASALWITEAIPPFTVSIFIIVLLVVSQGTTLFGGMEKDVSAYVNVWSSPIIWLLLGGFFLARGLEKTGIDQYLFRITVRWFGKNERSLLFGLMLLTAIGSMFMSNTATATMVITSLSPFIASQPPKSNYVKALLLGVAGAATVGGVGTIIGSPPNAIAIGALNTIKKNVDFGEWMAYGVPIALTLVVIIYFALLRKFKIGKTALVLPHEELQEVKTKGDRFDRAVVLTSLFLTVGLWMTSSLHNLPISGVAGIPIVFLTITSVLTQKDVREMPWDTLMLVSGGLALGIAVEDTKLTEYFVEQLNLITHGWEEMGVILLICVVTLILSNLMSNTATTSIIAPVAVVLFPDNPVIASVSIAISSSAAMMLPVSTPPNAIAFSSEQLEQKDFRYAGKIMLFVAPILILLWVRLMYGWMVA